MSDAIENLKKKTLEKAYKKDSKGHPKIEEEAALLRGMAEMFEEWKPFPKDKVERSIEKKEKTGDSYNKKQAHVQKAVKNYKTRSTDFHKADQKMVGSDRKEYMDKNIQHADTAEKALKKHSKAVKKADNWETKTREKIAGTTISQKTADKLNKKQAKKSGKAEDKRTETKKQYGRKHGRDA